MPNPRPRRRAVRFWTALSLCACTLTLPSHAAGLIPDIALPDHRLLLRYAEFDPLAGEPPISEPLTAAPDNEIYLVQFTTRPLNASRQGLRDAGATLHKFLAHNAYIVRMDADARDRVAALPFVRWVGPYHPAYRLDPDLLAQHFAPAKDGEAARRAVPPQSYNIQVFERGPAQKAAVAVRIQALGGAIDELYPEGFLLRATLTPDQLAAVLRMNEVMFADLWGPPEEDMNVARDIGGATYIQDRLGFTGQGVRGEVMDSNVRDTHRDFSAPPVLFHGPHGGDAAHGTSTYGIVFGDGTANQMGRGLLHDAEQGIFADFNSLTNRHAHTARLADPEGPYRAVFQSNSWGNPLTTAYTTISGQMDDMILTNDILIAQSQSNSGTQMSRPQAWAKNIVSVGGVRHQNTLVRTDDCWCGGYSRGPAADGRVKPDLTHFGDSVFTTSASADNGYTNFSGTSSATPIVAGYFGLFFQMWSEGVFAGFGGGGDVFDDRPHMAVAKAALINSARQYAFTNPNADLSRMRQGWGMPNVEDLYNLSERTIIVNETEVLTELQTAPYEVVVAADEPVLKITLVYADPGGTTSSTRHRINDLTLKATSPSNVVYWGNNGLNAGNWSTPGGNPNIIDTVENIFLQLPEPGGWLVEVIAAEINEDSHLETPEMDADFALIVAGATAAGCVVDWNGDGQVTSDDFFAFLDDFFAGAGGADFNNDGQTTSEDFFSFLTAYFEGC